MSAPASVIVPQASSLPPSPQSLEEYRQSVRAWHLAKQRDTLASIWDEPSNPPTSSTSRAEEARGRGSPIKRLPYMGRAAEEQEDMSLEPSTKIINPLTGQPFVKHRQTSTEPPEATDVRPSPRRGRSGMKSIHRNMVVYDDTRRHQQENPETASISGDSPVRSRIRSEQSPSCRLLVDSPRKECNVVPLAAPPVLSASCSTCSSSSATTQPCLGVLQGIQPDDTVGLDDNPLPLSFANLALANEASSKSTRSEHRSTVLRERDPVTSGLYGAGVIDLASPAETPSISAESMSAPCQVVVTSASSKGSPLQQRPDAVRRVTGTTNQTEGSSSSESFAGLMDSPWVSPAVLPGKNPNNRLGAEMGRMFAKQAAANSAAAASASAALVASLKDSHPGVPSEPPTPACLPPPEFRFNPVEPHVGSATTSDSSSPFSSPPDNGTDNARPGHARRMFRNVTFQRPHSKTARAKGRGGNWTGEEIDAV